MPRSTIFSAEPYCRTLRSVNDQRSVSGRNVKQYVADHRSEIIRVYTLRERVAGGPLRKVRQTLDLVEALQWVGREDLDSQWTLQG
jgi:hypothetical protein